MICQRRKGSMPFGIIVTKALQCILIVGCFETSQIFCVPKISGNSGFGIFLLASSLVVQPITSRTTRARLHPYSHSIPKIQNSSCFDSYRQRPTRCPELLAKLSSTDHRIVKNTPREESLKVKSPISLRVSSPQSDSSPSPPAPASLSSSSSSSKLAAQTVLRPLILLLVSQFLLFFGVGAVIPSIPLYGQEIGLSSAANGIVISAPAVAMLLVANWGGTRADQARKPAMILGMAIIAVADVGTAVATTLPVLLLARLVLGAGRALSEAGERGMLVDLANQIPSLRGRALAAQQAVVALGITFGAPTGGVIVEQYGPRAAFLCVSAAAVVALILYTFLPETIIVNSNNKSSQESGLARQLEPPSGPKIWMELLKESQWRGLVLCQSGISFGFAAKIASIPILVANTLPGGAAGAGALLSAAGLSGLVGAPVGGWSTDRIGAKSTAVVSGFVSSIGLLLVPLALSASSIDKVAKFHVSIGGTVLDSEALFFSMAVMLWSLGATAQGPALTALAQQYSPPGAEATSLSLVKASGDGTYIVVPFLMGLFADAFEISGIDCAFAGSAIFLGTCALAWLVDNPRSTHYRDG
jgi:MFS family permease